jgi:hypothetical protein
MHDNFTGDSVDIRVDENCGPYIMIEPAKLAAIEAALMRNGIPYSLDNGPDSCHGDAEAAVIEFGKEADVESIGRVLRSVHA